MNTVTVVGYRHRIDPPTLGDCADPECRTLVAGRVPTPRPVSVDEAAEAIAREIGRGVLLVAAYGGVSVCAACDERHLRAWLEDES
jgi:hypothetical protein